MAPKSVNILSLAMLGAAFISLRAGTVAQAATLNFDELPAYQQLDGLSFEGVTFHFQINGVNSTDAYYNAPHPNVPNTRYIDWPALDGSADGILTLDFDTPVSMIEFGSALGSFSPVTPGFTVELFDSELKDLGTTAVDAFPQPGSHNPVAENLFSYTGTPVKRLVYEPNDNFTAFTPRRTFSIDNLNFTPVPEPASMANILALGALSAFSQIKRQRKQTAQGSGSIVSDCSRKRQRLDKE